MTFVLYLGLFVSPVIYSKAIIPPISPPTMLKSDGRHARGAARCTVCDPPFQWYYSFGGWLALAATDFLSFQRAEPPLVDRL